MYHIILSKITFYDFIWIKKPFMVTSPIKMCYWREKIYVRYIIVINVLAYKKKYYIHIYYIDNILSKDRKRDQNVMTEVKINIGTTNPFIN